MNDEDVLEVTHFAETYGRPFVVLWFESGNNAEQISKYVRGLPDRIGDRDWKIYTHDHKKGEQCIEKCGQMSKESS